MYDELVHVLCLVAESCGAIAAGFGGAELQLEERVVARADDGEVVGHAAQSIPQKCRAVVRGSRTRTLLVDSSMYRSSNGDDILTLTEGETVLALLRGEGISSDDREALVFQHQTTKMFGAFKPSAPLSGGLLWCVDL